MDLFPIMKTRKKLVDSSLQRLEFLKKTVQCEIKLKKSLTMGK